MASLQLAAILVTLSAIFAWLNHRFIRMPATIGLMLIALLFSLSIVGLSALGFSEIEKRVTSIIAGVDFDTALLHGMLSFLLFAGALHVNLAELNKQKWVVAVLATLGVIISTFVVGALIWGALGVIGVSVPLIYCLIFGALISPTDPIAVLGILKKVGAPKSLEIKIAGESLFNDGVGVAMFIVLLQIARHGDMDGAAIATLFATEAIGGILFGLLVGGITTWTLRRSNDYQVEVLITLSLVMGGYALATALHVSGPVAVVVAGLMVGYHGRAEAGSHTEHKYLDTFWELMDEILNAILFVLIGLELLVLSFHGEHLLAALLAIPIVLLARFISVGFPIILMHTTRTFARGTVSMLTWGGLRGGVSVALALSLPNTPYRELILTMTYVVVVFSILVQGLTIGPVMRRVVGNEQQIK